jgi:hypothetical protein
MTNTNFQKPSDAEVAQLATKTTAGGGVTGYAVAQVVNEWLAQDGVTWVDSKGVERSEIEPSRVYSQFAGKFRKANPEMCIEARFTPEGAQALASLVYAHLKVNGDVDIDEQADELDENEQLDES